MTEFSGPLFDGRADLALEAFKDEAAESVAEVGENDVQRELRVVLRNPTGYYQSRIVTDRATTGNRIHDSGVVYGPWLEGTGSRNKTTRFKGYSTFRRVAQVLELKAGEIAEHRLPEYLGRMG